MDRRSSRSQFLSNGDHEPLAVGGVRAVLTLHIAAGQETRIDGPSALIFDVGRRYAARELQGLPENGWIGVAKDGGQIGGWRCALVPIEVHRMQHYRPGIGYLQAAGPAGAGPIEYAIYGLDLPLGPIDCVAFELGYDEPVWVDVEHPNLWPTAREHYEVALGGTRVTVSPALSGQSLQAVLQIGEVQQVLFELGDDEHLLGLETPVTADFDRDGRADVLVTVVTADSAYKGTLC